MTDLNFIEKGKGEKTLVFLHFFGGSSKSWIPVIENLQHDYRCIAIDLPGFGNSPAPETELSVLEIAEKVIGLIKKLKLEKYILIGHSMGGKIALAIAMQQQSFVEAIILVAPSPPTPEPMDDVDGMINSFGNKPAIEKLIKKITWKKLSQDVIDNLVDEHLLVSKIAWNSWITKASQEDISGMLSYLNIPLKVISGQHDPNFSTQFLKEVFKKYLPNTQFEEQKETGHLIPIEVPSELSKSIAAFIR